MTKLKPPPKTIEELMTPNPIAISGAASASDLAVILDENEVSGLPVTDQLDRVIGVVSRTDLLHRCIEGPLGTRPEGSFLASVAEGLGGRRGVASLGVVSEFMNPDPVIATLDDPPSAVAARMMEERVHRVIIVDEERHLLGILTTLDMLRVIATETP